MELVLIGEHGSELCGSGCDNKMRVNTGSGGRDAGKETVGESCLAGGDEEGAAYRLKD